MSPSLHEIDVRVVDLQVDVSEFAHALAIAHDVLRFDQAEVTALPLPSMSVTVSKMRGPGEDAGRVGAAIGIGLGHRHFAHADAQDLLGLRRIGQRERKSQYGQTDATAQIRTDHP